MGKSLLDKIAEDIWEATGGNGRYGEQLTARELKLVNLLGRHGKILRNVYIPKENGETTEIDVMYISQKGIFVLESKNYSGWIFGSEEGQYWTMMLPNKQKEKFYNPIKQNKSHMKWLGNYINNEVPLFSIIVFSERCELKKVTFNSDNVRVIKRDRTYATIRDIWEASPDVLSDDAIDKLYVELKELTHVSRAKKKEHIENIKNKYGDGSSAASSKDKEQKNEEVKSQSTVMQESDANSSEKYELNSEISKESGQQVSESTTIEFDELADSDDIKEKAGVKDAKIEEVEVKTEEAEVKTTSSTENKCPKCGKELVLRIAKKGNNAGKQFYGCSGFPKCRYVKNVD